MVAVAAPVSAQLNDVLRAKAKGLIIEGKAIPEIQRETGLCRSTIRWIAYRSGLTLMTQNGPTTHTPTYWRTSLAPQPARRLALAEVATVSITSVESPNYRALMAHLRW